MITKKQYNELKKRVDALELALNGGKGSGNFGHSGRPGEVGGSAPKGSGGVGGGKGDSDAANYIHNDPRGKYADGFDTLETAKEYIVDKAGDSFSGGLGEQIAMAYEDDARDFLDLPSRDEESDGAEMSMSDYADLQGRMQEVIREKSWDDLETDLDITGVKTALDYGLNKGGYEFASKNAELGQAGLSHGDAVRDLKSFIADFGITDHYGAIKAAEGGDLRTAWQNISYDMRDKLKDEYDYDPMSRNAFKGATTNDFVPRPEELYKNGGKGSGNFGHAGRPGEVGGSAPSSASSLASGRMEKGIRETDFENEMDGGFTIDLKTGNSYRLGKSDGYAVGGFGTEGIISLEDWNDKTKREKFKKDYIKKNRKALDKEGMCLGGWVPTSGDLKGKVVLDVSKVFKDKKQAARQAMKTDQDSITDFKNIDWPETKDLVKEFGLEKEYSKYKGLREKERKS